MALLFADRKYCFQSLVYLGPILALCATKSNTTTCKAISELLFECCELLFLFFVFFNLWAKSQHWTANCTHQCVKKIHGCTRWKYALEFKYLVLYFMRKVAKLNYTCFLAMVLFWFLHWTILVEGFAFSENKSSLSRQAAGGEITYILLRGGPTSGKHNVQTSKQN